MVLFLGRVLSVTWSIDANYIYSGSSDGYVLMLLLINDHCVTIVLCHF